MKKRLKSCLTVFLVFAIPSALFFILLFIGKYRYNDTCSVCHEMRQAKAHIEMTSHKKLQCRECHAPLMPIRKMIAAHFRGGGSSKKSMLDGGTTAQCKACHLAAMKPEIVFNKAILFSHQRHEQRAPGCTVCHKYTSHPVEPPQQKQVSSDICRDCHSLQTSRRGPKVIQDLHVYEKQPHPSNWIIDHRTDGAAPGRNCANCHKDAYCTNCHTKFVVHGPNWRKQHGEEAQKDLAPCQVCHLPEGCADCHNNRLPKSHATGWVALHAKDLNVKTCETCHRLNFCKSCHSRSKPSSHTDTMIRNHAGFSKGAEAVCAICHDQNPCMNCHKIEMPHSKEWPTAHAKQYKPAEKAICANCHSEKYCSTCHEKKTPASHTNIVQWKSVHGKSALKQKSDCSLCHQSHFCVSCHNLPMPHPGDWKRNHGISAKAKPEACAICHNKSVCTDCHSKQKPLSHTGPSVNFLKQHGAVSHRAGNCATCHDSKTFCEKCHGIPIPHPPALLNTHRDTVKAKGQSFCEKCHTQQFCKDCHIHRAKHPAGWSTAHAPAATADAKGCLTCHEPANCLKCHKSQVAGAKAVHPDCTYCHDDKTMKFQGVAACADCHSDVKDQMAALPVKQDCTICHKAHKWKVEQQACGDCHDMKKEELHAKPSHSVCVKCHTPHKWKPAGRETCLGCHVDKKDHNAPDLCWECHPFKK